MLVIRDGTYITKAKEASYNVIFRGEVQHECVLHYLCFAQSLLLFTSEVRSKLWGLCGGWGKKQLQTFLFFMFRQTPKIVRVEGFMYV